MMKDSFKMNQRAIFVLCLLLIALLAGIFLTKQKTSHKFEIFVLEGINHKKEEYLALIKEQTPVLTEKDIKAYNKETKMIFLNEDALKEYDEIRAKEEDADQLAAEGGSVILGARGAAHSFVISVDGEALIYGTVQRPLAVNYTPPGIQIADAPGGLRLYSAYAPADEKMRRSLEDSEQRLAELFQDMGLLTDKVFEGSIQSKTRAGAASGQEEAVYPLKADGQLKNILRRITEEPRYSSASKAYIELHPLEYYELLKLLSQEDMKKEIEFQEYQGLEKAILDKAFEELKERPLFLYFSETALKLNTDGSEQRALTDHELEDVRRAFALIRYDASLDKEALNPVAHLIGDYYENPEKINLKAMVRYMGSRTLVDDAIGSDTAKFEALKKLEAFPFKTAKSLAEVPVPIKEVFEEDVDLLLFNYLGTSLEKLDGIAKKDALYLEDCGSFFNYTSDFGLEDFIPESGEIDGVSLYLYGEDAKIVIRADEQKGKWYLYSFTKR